MYSEAATVVVQEAVKYAAKQYEDRKLDRKFEKLSREIVRAITAAKDEIIDTIKQVNQGRILDTAAAIIDVFSTYDRKSGEEARLQDIVSILGVQCQIEIERAMRSYDPTEIMFAKLFLPWVLVTSARAFSHVELTRIGKAKDYDDALRQFELIRDNSLVALSGLKSLNSRRFSGPFVEIDTAPGENLNGETVYYKDGQRISVRSFTNVPFKRDEHDSALRMARECMEADRESDFEKNSARKSIQTARDAACKHVRC